MLLYFPIMDEALEQVSRNRTATIAPSPPPSPRRDTLASSHNSNATIGLVFPHGAIRLFLPLSPPFYWGKILHLFFSNECP